MKNIEFLLLGLGLTQKEAETYLAILQHGSLSHTEVAKLTGVNRTTTYNTTKNLIEKGLIKEDLASASKKLVALPASHLDKLLEKDRELLHKRETRLREAKKALQNIATSSHMVIPKIVYIEEKDLEKFLFNETEKWHASLMEKDKCWWGFQDATFPEHFENWLDYSWKIVASDEYRVAIITNDTPVETKRMSKKSYAKRRDVRFWKESVNFNSTIWIAGDYIITVNTRTHPFYLVEMHDPMLAENLRDIFRAIWKTVPKRKGATV
jgi:sugar-specific transcriptional regulator TrmB